MREASGANAEEVVGAGGMVDPLNGVLTVLVTVAPVFVALLPVATPLPPLPPPALPEILWSLALALEFPARSGVAAL